MEGKETMKTITILAFMLAGLMAMSTALGQEVYDAGEAPEVETPAEEAPADEAAPETTAEEEKTVKEEVLDAKDAIKAFKDADATEKTLLFAAMMAALLNLLLTGIKRVMKLTTKGRKVLPWVALGAGLLIAIFERFVLGGSWMEAIIYGGAGPGAIIVEELMGTHIFGGKVKDAAS